MIFSVNQITQLVNNYLYQTYQVEQNKENIIFSTKSHKLSEYFHKLAVEELRNWGSHALQCIRIGRDSALNGVTSLEQYTHLFGSIPF